MSDTMNDKKSKTTVSIMDAVLYILAGSTMTMISVSFLLWLRF